MFPKDLAYRTRIYKNYWNTYDDLINCHLKLCPLTLHKLLLEFDIYNIIKNNILDDIVNDGLEDLCQDETVIDMQMDSNNAYNSEYLHNLEIDW